MTTPNLIDDPDSFLIYGDSGAGKTFLAGTCGARTLWINCGAGRKTLNSPAFAKAGHKKPNIILDFLGYAVSSDSKKVTEEFDNMTDALDLYYEKHYDQFDYVVLDDLTSLSRHANIKGMDLSTRSKTLAEARAKGSFPLGSMNDIQAEQNLLTWFFDLYIKGAKQRGKYFIALAHERKRFVPAKGADGKPLQGGEAIHKDSIPLVAGKDTFAIGGLPGMFDNVWHIEQVVAGERDNRKVESRVRTAVNGKYIVVKTRMGGTFYDIVVNPTFPQITDAIRKAEADPFNAKPFYGEKKL